MIHDSRLLYCRSVTFAYPKSKGKGIHALDIAAPLHSKSPPQKHSGMAHVLKGLHSFTCTPTRSSAIGMTLRRGKEVSMRFRFHVTTHSSLGEQFHAI